MVQTGSNLIAPSIPQVYPLGIIIVVWHDHSTVFIPNLQKEILVYFRSLFSPFINQTIASASFNVVLAISLIKMDVAKLNVRKIKSMALLIKHKDKLLKQLIIWPNCEPSWQSFLLERRHSVQKYLSSHWQTDGEENCWTGITTYVSHRTGNKSRLVLRRDEFRAK